MAADEKIMDRIRRMLAIAEQTHNENESATFAAKAQAMMQEYELELEDIRAFSAAQEAAGVQDEDVTEDEFGLKCGMPLEQRWRLTLMQNLAYYNHCHVINLVQPVYSKTGRTSYKDLGKVTIIGKRRHIEFCMYLYASLTRQIKGFARAAVEDRLADAKVSNLKWMSEFCLGAVGTISERLRDQARAFTDSAENARALVVRHDDDVKAYVAKRNNHLVNRGDRTGGQHVYDAYRMGAEAGKHVNLNRPLEGGKAPKIIK